MSQHDHQKSDAGAHDNPEKHGRIPRAWDQDEEKTVPRGQPESGPKGNRGKSNAHGHDYACYPKGIAPKR